MDDGEAQSPCLVQDLVHARGQLATTQGGIEAVVEIPHVADNDGRVGGRPALATFERMVAA